MDLLQKVMTCAQVQEAISLVMDNRQSIDLIISDAFLQSDDGLLILKSLALALDFAVISRLTTPKTYILANNSTWILDVFAWRSDVLE